MPVESPSFAEGVDRNATIPLKNSHFARSPSFAEGVDRNMHSRSGQSRQRSPSPSFAEGVDRNEKSSVHRRCRFESPSFAEGVDRNDNGSRRRAYGGLSPSFAEGVDRNVNQRAHRGCNLRRPLSQRAWIEIRSTSYLCSLKKSRPLSQRAWIEIRPLVRQWYAAVSPSFAEGVDRNKKCF